MRRERGRGVAHAVPPLFSLFSLHPHALPFSPRRPSSYLRVQQVDLGPPPRPGHPGLGVNDDAGRVNQPRLDERDERQLGGRRVTARVGDEAGGRHGRPGQLGQAVHRLRLQPGGRVRGAVPFLVQRRVCQPEIGRQVDDLDVGRQGGQGGLRGGVGQAAKGGVDGRPVHVGDLGQGGGGRAGRQGAGQVGEDVAKRLARVGLAGQGGDGQARVVGHQAHGLGAGVAGRAQDGEAGGGGL